MRNFLLAFGLILCPAVVMAAPSTSSCTIKVEGEGYAVTGCSTDELTLVSWAALMPTSEWVDSQLDRLARREMEGVMGACRLKGKPSFKQVEACLKGSDPGKRLVLMSLLRNIKDVKACKGLSPSEGLSCMINQDNQLLVPLIEAILRDIEKAKEGRAFIKAHLRP